MELLAGAGDLITSNNEKELRNAFLRGNGKPGTGNGERANGVGFPFTGSAFPALGSRFSIASSLVPALPG
jgi:hypothetical protein